MNIDTKIRKEYLDLQNPSALSGINQVHRYYKERYPAITEEKINRNLSSINTYLLHKEAKQLIRNPTFIEYKRQQLQIDLADVGNLSTANDGIRYLLVTIDVFTRFGFVVPLKNKKAEETLEGFKLVLQEAKQYPRTIFCDRGSEFKVYIKHSLYMKIIFIYIIFFFRTNTSPAFAKKTRLV